MATDLRYVSIYLSIFSNHSDTQSLQTTRVEFSILTICFTLIFVIFRLIQPLNYYKQYVVSVVWAIKQEKWSEKAIAQCLTPFLSKYFQWRYCAFRSDYRIHAPQNHRPWDSNPTAKVGGRSTCLGKISLPKRLLHFPLLSPSSPLPFTSYLPPPPPSLLRDSLLIPWYDSRFS